MIRLYQDRDKIYVEKYLKEHFSTTLEIGVFDTIYVYEEETIVGFLHFSIMYERAEINYFYVENTYRNQKIGTQLLLKMFAHLKEKDVRTVTLEVSVQNEAAIHVYQKLGFKQVGIRDKYYGGIDALLMMKDVSR